MAKSSLQFLERRNVDVYSSPNTTVRNIVKGDCGKVIVLAHAQGHALTLPSAAEAGEGWNCRFIVGVRQSDRSVRANTTIAAPGSDAASLVLTRNANALANDAGVAATAEMLELNGHAADDVFTITVPVAAGGTGQTFTFTMKANVAALTAAEDMTAGNFELARTTGDAVTAEEMTEAIVRLIKGEADDAAVGVRKPASGEGSGPGLGGGIQGITASKTNTDNVTITASNVGEAGDSIAFTDGGDGIIAGATIGAVNNAAGNPVGVSLDTRTISITAGGSKGDVVDAHVLNGEWFFSAYTTENTSA